MKDRIAQNPNNYLIAPEDGTAPYNAVITRADDPLEVGTPFNTNTMLKDTTAAMFSLAGDATPNDALEAIGGSLQSLGTKVDSIGTLKSLAYQDVAPISMGGTGATGAVAARRALGFTPVLIKDGSWGEGASGSFTQDPRNFVCYAVMVGDAQLMGIRVGDTIKGSGVSPFTYGSYSGSAIYDFVIPLTTGNTGILNRCKGISFSSSSGSIGTVEISMSSASAGQIYGIF